MAVTYIFQKGETIKIPLLLDQGDPDEIENVRANLKLTVGNKQIPDITVAPNAIFDVTSAVGGWILVISAAVSATLKPGLYVVNAALDISGETIITDPSYVKLEPTTVV